MRFTIMMLAVLAVFGMATVTMAKEGAGHDKADANVLKGKVVSVSGDKVVISTKGADNKKTEVTVTTDKDTKVTIDGQAKTIADLTAGLWVKVTPATGTATEITAKTPEKHKDKDGGAPKP